MHAHVPVGNCRKKIQTWVVRKGSGGTDRFTVAFSKNMTYRHFQIMKTVGKVIFRGKLFVCTQVPH